jgi:serine/threonine-protein kinase
MIGKAIDGKYRILELIGEGGMGAVYLAEHKTTGRNVAVKVISNEAVAQDEVMTARFEREAQAAAKVHSQHIVEILDAGRDPDSGHPFMVMEALRGEDVYAVFERLGPLPPQLALRIGVQTSMGLAKAHGVGVVHRDIKPANLFLTEKDGDELVVKLLDFGVAKFKMDAATETANQALTQTGSMLGSPMYMSPEQARGLKTIDHRADIWSLGVVLYQLLTGEAPNANVDGLGELIINICSEEPPRLDEKAPWVPQRIADAVHGALKLKADDRYQTGEEMAEALSGCLEGDDRLYKNMLVSLSDDERAAQVKDAAPAEAPAAPTAPADLKNLDRTVALDPDASSSAAAADAAAAAAPAAAAAGATKAGDSEPPATERIDEPEGPSSRQELKKAVHKPSPGGKVEVSDESGSARWMAVAVLLGVLIGGAALYYMSTMQP